MLNSMDTTVVDVSFSGVLLGAAVEFSALVDEFVVGTVLSIVEFPMLPKGGSPDVFNRDEGSKNEGLVGPLGIARDGA